MCIRSRQDLSSAAKIRTELVAMESNKLMKAEYGVRILSVVFAAMASLLVGLDTETETMMMIAKKATVKDLYALWIMTIVTGATAGHHLVQIIRCMALACLQQSQPSQNKFVAWFDFLLDQGATYATFGATMAGLQGAAVALFGVGSLQWSKLCNVYTRFCEQIAGGMLCALAATLTMAVAAAISAHRLFKLYPTRHRHHQSGSKN